MSTHTIAAAILAGGHATRLYGIAKGELKICNGLTIIDHLLNELKKTSINQTIIVSNHKGAYQHHSQQVISDLRKDVGPLAGIESALEFYNGDFDATLFIPCDLPNFSAKEFQQLIEAFNQSTFPVIYARTDTTEFHPLCCIIKNDIFPEITQALDNGYHKVTEVFDMLGSETVHFDRKKAFININCLKDL